MAEFASELTRQFLDHWCGLAREGLVPRFQDFLDTPIPKFAPIVTVFDLSETDMVIRLQGTTMVERRGIDKTGMSFFEANPLMPRKAILSNAWACVRHPCGIGSISSYGTSKGRNLKIETLSLPLTIDPPKLQRFVNVAVYLEELASAEYAVGLTEMHFKWIDVGAGVPDRPPRKAN